MKKNIIPVSTKKTLISAGVVPIFYQNDQPYFLLLRAYNYWDFPKGIVEADESTLIGALRELEEEAGITNANFRWGEVFYETEAYSNNKKIAKYYVACVQSDKVTLTKNPKTGIIEHHQYKWCSYAEANALLVPRVLKVLQWADRVIKK